MSIEISKIIDVYDQSISIVSAKNELFIDNPSTISSQTEIISRPSQTEFQMWTTYMVKSLKNLLKMWLKKYQMFGMLNMINKVSLDQLHSTLSSLRNNTNLLTKQEQLISQMQMSIKQWNEIKDPLLYYDLKKRQSLKSDMQKKISQLKENSALTKKSEAPMYLRKVQQELKNTIYSVYINQMNIDSKIIEKGVCQWQDSIAFVYRQYKELSNLEVFHFVAETRNRFVDMFAEQILRRGKVNDRFFVKYNQEINNAAKNIGKFWTDYRSSFDTLLTITKSYIKIFNQYKQDLRNRQTQVIKHLQKPSPTMSRIFKIDMSLKAITCLNKIFEIIPILTNFESSIKNLRNLVHENVQYCTQFRNGIVKNIGIREKDFYICSVDDKNYLDSCVKSQSSIKKKLIDVYAKFLKDIDCISKDNLKLFQKQFVPVYEAHEVGSLLNRQINSYEGQIRMDRSRVSTNSTGQTSIKDLKVIKNQKLSQIELFLSKLQLYDPSSINWSRNNIFSCALGPRLLLHGSMAIMEQGVYFESVFNKKNLFFGRTRIFVPRAEIFEIDTQNTLMIFPDAVELKTKVGSIYFHSLGYRQTISNTLNQVYFPQNVQNGEDCATDIDFNEYQEGQFQKLTPSELQEILKPYQNVVIEKIFKGIKLNKFFRRYFGNDTFEIRGNTYENFRNYFLLQIQAIQPKATPITPQPPSYFNYKKQQQPVKNCPKISERYHTYKKAIPKIPFLSSGGEGLCEDKQIYRWVTPQILVIDCVSKVKGFSLVQGMQILTRIILKQENGDVKLNISNSIKFSTQSSTNGLLKGPAQSNLKQSTLKMIQIIQKYEKGKKGRVGKDKEGGMLNEQNELMQENMKKIIQENKKLKRNFKLAVIIFVIIYLLTLLSIRLIYF